MVLLTEIESTAQGLMGSTVDDVVVRLSEPTLNTIINFRRQVSPVDIDNPAVLLRSIGFFVPGPDDHVYWPDWENYQMLSVIIKQAGTSKTLLLILSTFTK